MRSGLQAVLARMAKRQSLVLCHHGVGVVGREEDPLLLRVPPARLREQLQMIGDAGFEFRTVSELLADRGGDGRPRPGVAALSFDDGMRDNHSMALPMLRDLGIPATFYIATGFIGARNPFLPPATGERMMNPAELRDLAAAGMELGGHTVSHPDLSQLSYDDCLHEIATGRQQLLDATGVLATTFAYPFGLYADPARAAARDAGFDAAVTCNGLGSEDDPFAMPRTLLWGTDRPWAFVGKTTGAYQRAFDQSAVRLMRDKTRRVRHGLRRIRSVPRG